MALPSKNLTFPSEQLGMLFRLWYTYRLIKNLKNSHLIVKVFRNICYTVFLALKFHPNSIYFIALLTDGMDTCGQLVYCSHPKPETRVRFPQRLYFCVTFFCLNCYFILFNQKTLDWWQFHSGHMPVTGLVNIRETNVKLHVLAKISISPYFS